MLCPVCKLNPLTGRKATAKTCSTKCRSTLYRERKQQRATSQQAPGQALGTRSAPGSSAPRRQRSSSRASTVEWTQLISAATEHIVDAIQKYCLSSWPRVADTARVDMREQIVAQVPKLAVGYRLVLPAPREGDTPKLVPKRCRSREVGWYALTPFEYPDDIRLCEGCWYRIVWIDAQGQRIQLRPGESVPGLCYCIGPLRQALRHSGSEQTPEPSDPMPQSVGTATAPPESAHPPPPLTVPDNRHESDTDGLQIPLLTKMSNRDKELSKLVNAIAAKIRPEDLDPQPPPDVPSAKRADTRPSLLASLPPPACR